jgi:hypothetical protein
VERWPTNICLQPVASSLADLQQTPHKLTERVTKCPQWTAAIAPLKSHFQNLAGTSHQRLRAFVTKGTITGPAVMREYTRSSYGIQPA